MQVPAYDVVGGQIKLGPLDAAGLGAALKLNFAGVNLERLCLTYPRSLFDDFNVAFFPLRLLSWNMFHQRSLNSIQ